MKNCAIMNRMKNNYENRNKYFLTRRTPVIIRLNYVNNLLVTFT